MKSILIVEDDLTFAIMLKTWLEKKGFEVTCVSSVARAKTRIEETLTDLILSDLRLPDHDGICLLQWMLQREVKIPLIIMTSYADIQSAVQAMKLGACDYIAKPVNPEELLKKISEALQRRAAVSPKVSKSGRMNENRTDSFMEGESDASRQLFNYVGLVAPTQMSVLINGSSGTGKEYVAHRIHELSKRNDRPFVAVDCGAIPKELAASEFFGHIKGSFTGALTDKTGAFVAAHGGTLFLDEIGNLGYEVQIQLLRALQERKIRPVGSTQEIPVDIRLISATNEHLEQAIGKGTFREDLYHRINEFTLRMPDLRERQGDILLFANFFLDQANRELDKCLTGFAPDVAQSLLNYHWPGNLRQMKNVIMRATLLAQGNHITLSELDPARLDAPSLAPTAGVALHDEETEKRQIVEALRQTGNNKSKAAHLLQIDRKTLYNKLKFYGIEL